jgi:hypothetical protein
MLTGTPGEFKKLVSGVEIVDMKPGQTLQ